MNSLVFVRPGSARASLRRSTRACVQLLLGTGVTLALLPACGSNWPEPKASVSPPAMPRTNDAMMTPSAGAAGAFAPTMIASTPRMGEGQASGQGGATAPGPLPAGVGGSPVASIAFTRAEVELMGTLSPLPAVPADPTNALADDAEAAVLGQALFFDPAYSGPLAVGSDLGNPGDRGKVACVSCHWGQYMDDQRSMPRDVSLGADYHARNALTVINSSYQRFGGWGGRFSAQWELPLAVAESAVIMNGSRLGITHLIFDRYRSAYEAAFGTLEAALGTDSVRFPPTGKPKPAPSGSEPSPADGAWETMTAQDQALVNTIFVNFGKAMEAYLRSLVSRDAPFDRFVAGDATALTLGQQRGLRLFIGQARCTDCHYGPHLSDDQFHNLGVLQTGAHVPGQDTGRYKDMQALLASPFNSASPWSDDPDAGLLAGLTNPPPAETQGAFRTPDLRGVALTPPYMHAGQLATLTDVIDFFDRGGDTPAVGTKDPRLVPLYLSAQDKADLLDFLTSLNGSPPPSSLVANPFTSTATPW
ncbi:MAG: cytochrome-c peroxidase [Polyangiales bacterium]